MQQPIATMKAPSWDSFTIDSSTTDPAIGLEALEDKIAAVPLGADLVNVIRVATGRDEVDTIEVELSCVRGSDFESPINSDDELDDDELADVEGESKSADSKRAIKKGYNKRSLPRTIAELTSAASLYDKELYSTLKQLVKGPLQAHLTLSSRRRFTIAMIILWQKACPVSVSSKRIALQKMLSLPKCDNTETLGREVILARALLKRSKVSPDEMLLLFYSQAGLPSKIQFDIVDDISNGELEDTSFYDLVARYQDAISAVQSSDNQGSADLESPPHT